MFLQQFIKRCSLSTVPAALLSSFFVLSAPHPHASPSPPQNHFISNCEHKFPSHYISLNCALKKPFGKLRSRKQYSRQENKARWFRTRRANHSVQTKDTRSPGDRERRACAVVAGQGGAGKWSWESSRAAGSRSWVEIRLGYSLAVCFGASGVLSQPQFPHLQNEKIPPCRVIVRTKEITHV